MKRLIYAIALLICFCAPLIWAQSSDYELVRRDTLTFGKGLFTADSLVMTFPRDRGASLFKFRVSIDSLDGGASFDTTLLYARQAYGATASEIFTAADGEFLDWALVRIYEGGDTFTNWSYSVPLQDGDLFDVDVNMGGHVWDSIAFKITQIDSAASPADSGRVIIAMWRQK